MVYVENTDEARACAETGVDVLSIERHLWDAEMREAAGAFAAEIEVVPPEIATEISRRTSLVMFSMGAGAGCDAQYLFSCDLLGYTRGHLPRHAKVYRDFASEFDRLQRERVAAFSEFIADVDSGAYPEQQHLVPVDAAVVDEFLSVLDAEEN
jgi:3-methyl-2-oxobutanoate hydroxymethyltransferase